MAIHMRSSLARTMYYRLMEDTKERNRDHYYWYEVNDTRLPEMLCDRFLQCYQDAETNAFLDNCYKKSDWILTQVFQLLIKSVLTWVMSSTSVNGLLGRGSMFVFSKAQFRSLLGIDEHWLAGKLLDLGAGDGMITQQMAPHFKEVFATEMSYTMVWRLGNLGYSVLGIQEWANGTHQYDVISCLNLLDRCEKPVSILHDIRRSLVPRTGRAVVATVIPFRPYIEYGWSSNHRPEQYLHIRGKTFEEQVASLTRDVFEPAGFTVEKFTRVPYLCEGDLEHSFYVLDDSVFVLKPS